MIAYRWNFRLTIKHGLNASFLEKGGDHRYYYCIHWRPTIVPGLYWTEMLE